MDYLWNICCKRRILLGKLHKHRVPFCQIYTRHEKVASLLHNPSGTVEKVYFKYPLYILSSVYCSRHCTWKSISRTEDINFGVNFLKWQEWLVK